MIRCRGDGSRNHTVLSEGWAQRKETTEYLLDLQFVTVNFLLAELCAWGARHPSEGPFDFPHNPEDAQSDQ